jgi:hypothetical protein
MFLIDKTNDDLLSHLISYGLSLLFLSIVYSHRAAITSSDSLRLLGLLFEHPSFD